MFCWYLGLVLIRTKNTSFLFLSKCFWLRSRTYDPNIRWTTFYRLVPHVGVKAPNALLRSREHQQEPGSEVEQPEREEVLLNKLPVSQPQCIPLRRPCLSLTCCMFSTHFYFSLLPFVFAELYSVSLFFIWTGNILLFIISFVTFYLKN